MNISSGWTRKGGAARELGSPATGVLVPGGGSWLRIGLAFAGLLTMVALWIPGQAGGQVALQIVVMAGIEGWLVARPGSAASTVLLIGALCLRTFLGRPELDGSLITLVMLLPLVHQLAALSTVVPLRSNVYLPALLPTLLRYLGAVLTTIAGLIISRLLGWW